MNRYDELKNEFSDKNIISFNDANKYGNKTKYYIWQCAKDKSHEWSAKLNKRLLGNNCPHCNGDILEMESSILIFCLQQYGQLVDFSDQLYI